jgi:uncharacterized protein YqgC (DUF456 family)
MLDATLLILLVTVACAGIVLAVMQLPGSWLILAAALGYDWYYGFSRIGWKWLVALTVLAAAAEVVEALSSAVIARRAGASRRASIGALLGGLIGMFSLSFVVPIPIIGTIAGGFLGCFLGALLGEMTQHDDLTKGTRVGIFAMIGRLLGLIAKTAASLTIAGAVVLLAVFDRF